MTFFLQALHLEQGMYTKCANSFKRRQNCGFGEKTLSKRSDFPIILPGFAQVRDE